MLEIDRMLDESPSRFARGLVALTCHPTARLRGGEFVPTDKSLTQSDVDSLSAKELEDYAARFIKTSAWLWPEGSQACPQPSANGESCVDLLHRMFNQKARSQRQAFKDMLGDQWDEVHKKARQMSNISKNLGA